MKRKVKLALAITLVIAAVMLITTYAMFYRVGQKILNQLTNGTDEPANDPYLVALLVYLVVLVGLAGFIMKVIALPMLAIGILFLVFVPIVLSAQREEKLRNSTMVLMILSVIFTVLSFLPLIYCWLLAMYSVTMTVLVSIANVCLVGCLITIIVSYAKLRKYCKKMKFEHENETIS